MATEFDLNSPDVPDDVIRSIANEMSGGGLKPLSDQERLEWEAWRAQQLEQRALADERRRLEHEERRAEAEAQALHEAALERAELNRKQRLQRSADIERQTRELELRDLQSRVRSHQVWQTGVQNAVRNQLADQYRQTLMGELDALVNPPQPIAPLEPEAIEVGQPDDDLGSPNIADDDFNAGYWLNKPIFKR